ncbi:MAG: phosphoadenosine phosphosulfate reductase family protein [Clostridiales bacterium]|nr:phosphoadenosine phosphosulfate reductase family protein [Clostridiales bacterium]
MKHILSFSGGKDSTYLAFYLIENGYPLDEVVMFDTGWEFPQMYAHIEKMRVYFENHSVKFTVLKPKNSFDYLMADKPVKERGGGQHFGYSWCGLKGCRWGTSEKLVALDKYIESQNAIVYIGIAADETARLQKERKLYKRFPLAENDITEAECLRGCYERGLPGTDYTKS